MKRTLVHWRRVLRVALGGRWRRRFYRCRECGRRLVRGGLVRSLESWAQHASDSPRCFFDREEAARELALQLPFDLSTCRACLKTCHDDIELARDTLRHRAAMESRAGVYR